jgi:hypothetical protein
MLQAINRLFMPYLLVTFLLHTQGLNPCTLLQYTNTTHTDAMLLYHIHYLLSSSHKICTLIQQFGEKNTKKQNFNTMQNLKNISK